MFAALLSEIRDCWENNISEDDFMVWRTLPHWTIILHVNLEESFAKSTYLITSHFNPIQLLQNGLFCLEKAQ